MSELEITMLPAKEGDCLLLSYGEPNDKRHVLIDAGRAWTWRHALKSYLAEHAVDAIELLVVTHVDRDHIDGVLALMRDPEFDIPVRNIWFNTYDHLLGHSITVLQDDDTLESFGAKMGEELSPLIVDRGWRWNHAFDGHAVALGRLPGNAVQLGELSITLLSPDQEKLDALRPRWELECREAGITPGASLEEYFVEDDELEPFGAINVDALAETRFEDDGSPANGSSIGMLIEYDGRRVLLPGDAHVGILVRELRALGASEAAPLPVDAFKIPHHGSRYNVSTELLALLDCRHYLVSTNGNYFKHPDDVAMSRLVKYGSADSTIHFNYATDFNRHWRNPVWEARYRYSTVYPEAASDGFATVSL